MVRLAILRLAQESGHTVITSELIEEATGRFCPASGGRVETAEAMPWSAEAERLLASVGDPSVNTSVRLRAEKRAHRAGSKEVTKDHVEPFLAESAAPAVAWKAEALARLARVPEMVRGSVRRRAEAHAQESGAAEVTLAIIEGAIEEGHAIMHRAMRAGGHPQGGTRRTEDDDDDV
jgi:hypothetical protein